VSSSGGGLFGRPETRKSSETLLNFPGNFLSCVLLDEHHRSFGAVPGCSELGPIRSLSRRDRFVASER
jgi:hypothetical protein